MASRTTFWPDTARMCASPERWKSVRTASDSRSSCPSTIPRSSAASFAGSPRASPTSARRRTRSSAPATPPRHAPVRRIRSTSSAACAPRRPWNASNLSSGATRPERTTTSPTSGQA